MRTCYLAILFAALSWGQLESNTITVTAIRSLNIQPDQVVFGVVSNSETPPSLGGLTGAELVSGAPGLPWIYTLGVPLSQTADTIQKLATLATTSKLTFSIQGTRVAPKTLAAQQCPKTDLIADARAQAQRMAAAAGVTLGPIVAILEPSAPQQVIGAIVPVPAFRNGDFSGLIGDSPGFADFLLGAFTFAPPISTPAVVTCPLTVKFALVRY